MTDIPAVALHLQSLVKDDGTLEVSFTRQPTPEPGDHEVLVEIQATPINPSDLFQLFPSVDLSSAQASERDSLPVVSAPVPPEGMRAMKGRIGAALPVGNEASGIVVAAGCSPEAQALIGKTVAIWGGGMYAEFRCVPAKACLVLPEGTDPRDAASAFVNPLTALGFVETAKRDGHRAIVHTAAASNLGRMLNRICIVDGVPLVNIVRSAAQVSMLRDQGAQYVINSADPDFRAQLKAAIAETRATVAFDAIGGGTQGSQLISAMEAVYAGEMDVYNRYGSDVFKQLYIYGALDLSPTVMNRTFGFAWSISGWLLTRFLAAAGPEVGHRMRERVVAELTTTFASHYSHEIRLVDMLRPEVIRGYSAQRTGEKYLVRP